MRSIATVCLGGTLERKLRAAAAAGFDAVELFEDDLIASPLRPAAVRALTREIGLEIALYQPFRDFEAVDELDLARADAKLALMEELGAPLMLVCSNVSPDAIDDDALAAEQLRALAERAAARGLRVAYEALAWGAHVNTLEHAWRIVQRADHPVLGVGLDSFHILARGEDPATIGAIPAEKLFFLQLADAPRPAMDVLAWSRHHRCFPGQGALDVAAVLRATRDAGYAGPVSLEVFNDVFRAADPERTARDALRSLLILEDALPPLPPLRGYAYVEVSGLPSAPHGVRLVPGVDAGIRALAFATGDPEAGAARAAALGAEGVRFERAEPARIDHVALSQPPASFDGALLLYRGLLGLAPHESDDLASPEGLLHGRALADDARRVRLTLDVPRAGEATALQHVAFACEDVLAAARRCTPLRVSDNYYDDLAARGALPPERVAELRSLGVLYDRDDRGGEFLHCFTGAAGGLYFEFLQRRGGYDGYGAANAAARSALTDLLA